VHFEACPRTPVTVLHLVDTLFVGGTERQLLEQLRVLDRRRWRPLAGSLHREGELLAELNALEVPHTAFPLRSSLGHPNTLYQIGRLAAHLVRHDVRLLHAHDFYSNVVGVAAARLVGRRVLASRRDLAHWLSPIQRAALGWSCRAADRVITNAVALAAQTVRDFRVDERRLVLLRNGLDLARFDRPRGDRPPRPSTRRRCRRWRWSRACTCPTRGRPISSRPRRCCAGAAGAIACSSSVTAPSGRCSSSWRAASASTTTCASSAAAATCPACWRAWTWPVTRRGPRASRTR
jgi:hypothetical protein